MKELVDQAAHFFAAAGVVLVAIFFGASFTPGAGLIIGFGLGTLREVTEDGSILSTGSITDICFWTLGGLFGTIIL